MSGKSLEDFKAQMKGQGIDIDLFVADQASYLILVLAQLRSRITAGSKRGYHEQRTK